MANLIEIGKSGIKVPFLGMGTWAIGGGSWWGDNDDELSVKTIQRAINLGIKWIDTAPIYGLYHSEDVVGKAIKGKREQIILSTKCALEWRHETPVFHKEVDGTKVYLTLFFKCHQCIHCLFDRIKFLICCLPVCIQHINIVCSKC